MDLTILFSPVDESLYADITSPSSFYKNIRAFTEKMPDYKGAHIALFGIKEERGSILNSGTASAPDEIRKAVRQNIYNGATVIKLVTGDNGISGIYRPVKIIDTAYRIP